MGMPVKLSDVLVRAAREEALATDRSITAQIEHWAKLGRAVEAALAHGDTLALKRHPGELARAFPDARLRDAVRATIDRVVAGDVAAVTDALRTRAQPVYGTDPRHPGLVVRIAPDGSRTPGRIVNRRFQPASPPARKRAAA